MSDKPRHLKVLDLLKKLWELQHKREHLPDSEVLPDGTVYRGDTSCYVETLSYDFRTKCGELRMPGGSCTDMVGCIQIFQAIDPEVREVATFAGDQLDTSYRRSRRAPAVDETYGNWVAIEGPASSAEGD